MQTSSSQDLQITHYQIHLSNLIKIYRSFCKNYDNIKKLIICFLFLLNLILNYFIVFEINQKSISMRNNHCHLIIHHWLHYILDLSFHLRKQDNCIIITMANSNFLTPYKWYKWCIVRMTNTCSSRRARKQCKKTW